MNKGLRVGLLSLCLVLILSAGAFAAPPITWNPGTLSVQIGSGIAQPVEVTFHSARALHDVQLEVVPELAPFISVADPAIASVDAGSDHTVELSFYLPPNTPEGVYDGTLHLRQGHRTLAQPLPIVLTVDYGGAVLSPGTRVLSRDAAGRVAGVSADRRTLTFQGLTGELLDIQQGEVLVVPASDLLPSGFLGRVVSVAREGDQLVVTTESAALTEAVQAADLEVHFALGADSVVQGPTASAEALRTKGLLDPIEVPLDTVLLDLDHDLETTDDQVRTVGAITLTPDIDLALSISDGRVDEFSITATASAHSELSVEAQIEASFERERELGRYRFEPIVFWIGWLPVYIQPEISFSVGVSGQVAAHFTAGATADATVEAGVVYDGAQWSTTHDSSIDFAPIGPTLDASAQVEAKAGPTLSVLLYDVVGPQIDLTGYARLSAELGRCPYWWDLTAGVDLDAAIDMGPFSDLLAGPSYPGLISYEKLLAHAEDCGDTGGGGDGGGGEDGVPVPRGPVCYIDTSCSGSVWPGLPRARNAETHQCVDAFDCVELWKCPEGPTTGSCGGGSLDCTFSPGCGQDAQDCYYGFCRSLSSCTDRIKFQGYSFDPTPNQCTCVGNPPAAGYCRNDASLAITVHGQGNVTSDPQAVNCGSLNLRCEQRLHLGIALTLIPTPDPGYEFVRWEGDADCLDGQVTMAQDVSCTAVFQQAASVVSQGPRGSAAGGAVSELPSPLAAPLFRSFFLGREPLPVGSLSP